MDFQRLEKVEIGGKGGKSLSLGVANLYAKFNEESQQFASKTFDPLDLSSQDFDQAAELFLTIIKESDDELSNMVWSDLEGSLSSTPTVVKVRQDLFPIVHKFIN